MTTTSPSEPLSSWVRSHLEAIYEYPPSSPERGLETSFDAMFSLQSQILVNHVPVAPEAFRNDVKNRSFAASKASIDWREIIEVPKADSGESEAGIVAGCFVVTRSLKFRIRAGPAQSHSTMVFSAKIERDTSTQEGEPRRVVQLFLTITDRAAPIHLQGLGHNA